MSLFTFPTPPYVACQECGACVLRSALEDHACDPDRRLDYELCRLRPGIARVEFDFRDWLATNEGRFAVFYAERTRP